MSEHPPSSKGLCCITMTLRLFGLNTARTRMLATASVLDGTATIPGGCRRRVWVGGGGPPQTQILLLLPLFFLFSFFQFLKKSCFFFFNFNFFHFFIFCFFFLHFCCEWTFHSLRDWAHVGVVLCELPGCTVGIDRDPPVWPPG